MNRRCCASLILVVAYSIFAVAIASAATKSGYNSFSFGNSQAGAKGTYSVATEYRTGYSRVALSTTGSVMFLGKTAKGVEFSATSENNNGKKAATYQLSVAGYTVDSGTKSVSYSWNKSVTRTLLSGSAQFVVGPVPVTVSGSTGGGASIGYTFSLSTTGAGISGDASAWANGSASAGVGVTVLNLSLRSDLKLAKTSLRPSVNVTPTAWSGKTLLVYDPVSIDFSIALQTMKKVWYSKLLARYSQPSKTITLLQL
jgi:hypothetical protein